MRGVIANYTKIIDDIRKQQTSHHKTLFQTRKEAAIRFREQENGIKARMQEAREEGLAIAEEERGKRGKLMKEHAEEMEKQRAKVS
eukprot:CAMPEP_0169478630 /NCGR_PEP_ID=MMETSP1042-20121227/28575_1 /TAXON_ID=464988 /ORGANISM="Hemiselmis andersenii, Strain CCMP1180" /LENGTH=85 /DNA_ID=CAMNT_0009593105 /DNA_START=12 /DNA_END=266 /DNA_ORIENTATION=+